MRFLSNYDTYVLEQQTTTQKKFLHYVVNPKSKEVIIRNDAMGKYAKSPMTLDKTLDEMGIKNSIDFAMNCALYETNPHGENTGAYNFIGKKIKPLNMKDTQNFGMHDFPKIGRNAVLYTSGSKEAWNIVPSDKWDGSGYYAIQNGPILIWDGVINPIFKSDSVNLQSYRNGIGLDAKGNLHFTLALKNTSFYELSQYMQMRGCVKAIFCDGNVSQVFVNGTIQGEKSGLVGPIIIVNKSSEKTQTPSKNNQVSGGSATTPNKPVNASPQTTKPTTTGASTGTSTTAPPPKRKPLYDPNLRSKYKF